MADAHGITDALGGRWYGHYGLAMCPAHDNRRTGSLSLTDGEDGRLLAFCHAGCGFAAIADALHARGLTEGRSVTYDALAAERARRERERKAREAEKEKVRQAGDIWRRAGPVAGTLADRYLRARGIALDWTDPGLGLTSALRFSPSCRHGLSRQSCPAMIGLVLRGKETAGVHRTYLAEPGRKAEIDPVKSMLGPVGGGAVRLAGRPDSAGALVVAEGIETALSLLCMPEALAALGPEPRLWAPLSAPGMAGLVLPERPGLLIIAPDNDPAGLAAADTLATRAAALGWQARLAVPPRGDWNDILRGDLP